MLVKLGKVDQPTELQIFFKIGGPVCPIEQKWCVIFLDDGPKHIKLNTVDIWVVYFTYTLTQTLVCIYVY